MKTYAAYKQMADSVEGLIVCGRLGDFKYYYMEQALARALEISQQMKG